jgi:hypothetical protein
MIVVRIFKNNAWYLAGKINVIEWENCIKRLKLYFSDINKIKKKIIAEEIIDLPYLTFQKNRRVNKEKRIKNEQRRHLKSSEQKEQISSVGGGDLIA